MAKQFGTKVQSREKRVRNFREVSLGYPKKIAQDEARRCPQCSDPVCMPGCPLGIDIPRFIRYLRENDPVRALEIIREKNPFPAICGRVCPAPCEQACIFSSEQNPIGIRALERFAADYGHKRFASQQKISRNGKKIAVIGSGPAGLAAAAELAKWDYQVTIFEASARPGGMLRYGIPEFRLPENILDNEIQFIRNLGVEIKMDVFFGRSLDFEDMFKQGFAGVVLAVGAGTPNFSDIPGSHLGGVFYAQEFLLRTQTLNANGKKLANPFGGRLVVWGNGTPALDCGRTAARLGCDVTMIAEGTQDDFQSRAEDLALAKEEGLKLETLVKPLEILAGANGFTRALRCVRMDFAEAGEEGQWKLKPVPGSEFILETDGVVIASGRRPNPFVPKLSGQLKLNRDGSIRTDKQGMTSLNTVFACGDVATGAGTVVDAIASGKKVAADIHAYLGS